MNKRILISLSVIAVAAVVALGATYAYFSSTASVTGNTFSTGTLQIRVNGQSSITGFTFSNAAPGDCKEGNFDVNNYGPPWFAGPSTLTAKELVLSAKKVSATDNDLWKALTVKIERCAGPCEIAYNGKLKDLNEKNILMSWYSGGLAPGNSETIKYKVCLPKDGDQNNLQGDSVTFDFVVDAYNPHR